jgi:hypothetical protein
MKLVYRVYSFLLLAYPRDFRRHYGNAIRQSLRDLGGDQSQKPGRLAAILAVDWVTTMAREYAGSISVKLVVAWGITLAMYLLPNTNPAYACTVPKEVHLGSAH